MSGEFIVSEKVAAEHRRHAQSGKQISGDARPADHPRPFAILFAEKPAGFVAGGEPFEGMVLLPPIEIIWIRGRDLIRGKRIRRRIARWKLKRIDCNQPFGLGKRQRMKQDTVHQAEDRSGCPDANRQRQNDSRGKSKVAAELPESVDEILRELSQHGDVIRQMVRGQLRARE